MNRAPDLRAARKTGERTLAASVLLSAWAPAATGLAVTMNRSATQIADFLRRTVEFAAILASWLVFRWLLRSAEASGQRRASLERLTSLGVAGALGCSGAASLVLGFLRAGQPAPAARGHLGVVIAALGLVTNLWFWRRYAGLSRQTAEKVLEAQRRLYLGKSFTDLCVLSALGLAAAWPGAAVSHWGDVLGSLVVAGYLFWLSAQALRDLAAAAGPQALGGGWMAPAGEQDATAREMGEHPGEG